MTAGPHDNQEVRVGLIEPTREAASKSRVQYDQTNEEEMRMEVKKD